MARALCYLIHIMAKTMRLCEKHFGQILSLRMISITQAYTYHTTERQERQGMPTLLEADMSSHWNARLMLAKA